MASEDFSLSLSKVGKLFESKLVEDQTNYPQRKIQKMSRLCISDFSLLHSVCVGGSVGVYLSNHGELCLKSLEIKHSRRNSSTTSLGFFVSFLLAAIPYPCGV